MIFLYPDCVYFMCIKRCIQGRGWVVMVDVVDANVKWVVFTCRIECTCKVNILMGGNAGGIWIPRIMFISFFNHFLYMPFREIAFPTPGIIILFTN